MKYFNSVKLPVKIACATFALLGILFLIWPAFTLNFMRILCGIALIAFGGLKIYTYLTDVKKPGLPQPNLAIGCTLVAFGVFTFLDWVVVTIAAMGQHRLVPTPGVAGFNYVTYLVLLLAVVFATAYLLQRTYDLFKSHVQLWYVPACAAFVGLVLMILCFCIESTVLLGLSVFFMALFVLACDVFIAYVSEDKPAAPVAPAAAPVAEPEPEVTELEEL